MNQRIVQAMNHPTLSNPESRVRTFFIWSVVAAWIAILTAGCNTARTSPGFANFDSTGQSLILTNRLDPQLLQPNTNQFTLGPGDKLDLELIGETNSLTQTIVGPDGKIYFNILGGLDVWGLTLGETKNLLEKSLAEHIRNGPKVSVSLREVNSQRVWVLGRVQQPGVYALNRPMTLLELLAAAGGTTSFVSQRDIALSAAVEELADLKRSFVVRNGQLLPVDFDRLLNHGDLSQNIYLQPDDFIYLPPATAPQVYVIGAVGQPSGVAYTETLTLAGAIAAAYGTIQTQSHLSQVAIIRGSFSEPQISVVDFDDIQRGKAPDVDLQPGDIVHVPYSPYRYLVKYAETVLNTFAASMAINAGSRVVTRDPGELGVFIPVGSRITVQPPLPPVQ